MHLTRFSIDLRRRASQRYLTSPQRMHAAIATATTSAPASGNGRVLWRLDGVASASTERPPLLWVVSPAPPALDELAAEIGLAVGGVIYRTKPYGPFLDRLSAGQRYAFRLGANAVRSGKKQAGEQRSQRFGHVTAAQQLNWLLERAPRHGFELTHVASGEPDAAVVGRRVEHFVRDQKRVTIAIAEYEGILTVTEPDVLRATLISGIGHARAYGCGLLTIARAP